MSSILTFKISLWKSNKDTYPCLFFEGRTCSTHSKKFSNEWLRQESKLPFKIGFRSLPGWHWSPRQIWWTSRASTSYCIPEWWGLPDEDAPQAPQLWLAARVSPACGSHMQPSDCPRLSLFSCHEGWMLGWRRWLGQDTNEKNTGMEDPHSATNQFLTNDRKREEKAFTDNDLCPH